MWGDDDECPVCFNPTENRVQPCGHKLCGKCAGIWKISEHNNQDTMSTDAATIIHINFDDENSHLGITLVSGALGVRVVRLDRRDVAASAGVRRGDVITHINSIHTTSHSVAIDIIEQARLNTIPLMLRIHRPRRLYDRLMHRFNLLFT